MAQEKSSISWYRKIFGWLRGSKHGDNVADNSAGNPHPKTASRRSSRNPVLSKRSQSLTVRAQSRLKEGTGTLWRSRPNADGYTSEALETLPTQAIARRSSHPTPELKSSRPRISLDESIPRSAPALDGSSALALPQRTRAIIFKDQQGQGVAIPSNPDPLVQNENQIGPDWLDNVLQFKNSSTNFNKPSALATERSLISDTQATSYSTHGQHAVDIPRLHSEGNTQQTDSTGGASRPTQIIMLINNALEQSEFSSTYRSSAIRDTESNGRELERNFDLDLAGLELRTEEVYPMNTFTLESTLASTEELESIWTDQDVIMSFLSLEIQATYAAHIGNFLGQNGLYVSAWLLYCIAVLRLEKLRLSMFVQTATLSIGINLNDRFDLNPDDLVKEAWYTEKASVMHSHPYTPAGKPTGLGTKGSAALVQAVTTFTTLQATAEAEAKASRALQDQPIGTTTVTASIGPTRTETLRSGTYSIGQTEQRIKSPVGETLWIMTKELPNPEQQEVQSQQRQTEHETSSKGETINPTNADSAIGHETGESTYFPDKTVAQTNAETNSAQSSDSDISPEQDSQQNFLSAAGDLGQSNLLASQSIHIQHPGKYFFIRGRVFAMVLWREPALSSTRSLLRTGIETSSSNAPQSWTQTSSGEYISSHIQRYVVVADRQGFCLAVPIRSYGGKGLTKRKFSEVDRKGHAIIHFQDIQPYQLDGERPFTKKAIAVERASPDIRFHPASRINFRRPTTIEWTSRAGAIGLVNSDSINRLTTYFKDELEASEND